MLPIPTGATTGSVKDITAKEAGKPTLVEIAEAVGHNKISINIVWTLITGFLVMFMQAGFALVETGFTRAKNAAHTMGMNIMVYAIGMLGFWICGFAFMFGGVGQVAALGMGANLGNEVVLIYSARTSASWATRAFFLAGPGPLMTSRSSPSSCSRWSSWTPRPPSPPGPWRNAGSSRLLSCMAFSFP